jgi:hypothetical protein
MPLFVTEYANLARDLGGYGVAAGVEPANAEQTVVVTGASTQSNAFNERTAFLMVHAQEACCVAWGVNPTAVTTAQRMAAGETRFTGVPPGRSFKIAVIGSL